MKSVISSRDYKFVFAFSFTGFYFFIELIFGIVTNSLALKADAFHMLSDLIAISITFLTDKLSRKERNTKYKHATYGLARYEILGGVINSVFLLSSCLSIFIELIQRFFYIDEVRDTMSDEVDKLLIVAIIGLIVNIINFLIFQIGDCRSGHGHSHGVHSHYSEKGTANVGVKNLNIRAMMLHILGDMLGSVGVIITALCIKLIPYNWVYYMDPLCSLFIIGIIVVGTTPVLIKCIRILSQHSSKKIDISKLRKELLEITSVIDIHDLHIWRLDPLTNIATVHVYIEDIVSVEGVIREIKELFHSYSIHSTTVQPEFEPLCNEPICKKNCLEYRCCDDQVKNVTEMTDAII